MKTQTNSTQTNKQTGLTLVELMVAMIISLLLLGGTITIFMSNKQTYLVNEASSRVQENGRFSFDFLSNDVRMAGFFGCVSNILDSTNLNNIVDTSQYTGGTGTPDPKIIKSLSLLTGTNSLKGYAIGATLTAGELFDLGLKTGTAVGDALPNQDVIAMQIGESCNEGALISAMTNINTPVLIQNAAACNIAQDSVVLISDCTNADLFRVVNDPSGANNLIHSTGRNTQNELSKAYSTDANVYTLRSSIYYIGNGSSGEPALFRRVFSGAGAADNIAYEELVDGVESMEITYGVDTDGDNSANYYVRENNINATDWPQVISARIRLSAFSAQNNITQNTANADRKLRHTFTETIKIRNR